MDDICVAQVRKLRFREMKQLRQAKHKAGMQTLVSLTKAFPIYGSTLLCSATFVCGSESLLEGLRGVEMAEVSGVEPGSRHLGG